MGVKLIQGVTTGIVLSLVVTVLRGRGARL